MANCVSTNGATTSLLYASARSEAQWDLPKFCSIRECVASRRCCHRARIARSCRPQPQMVIAGFPQRPPFQETHLYGKRESRRRHSAVSSRGDWMPELCYGLGEIAATTQRNECGQRKFAACRSIGGVRCFGTTQQDNFRAPGNLVYLVFAGGRGMAVLLCLAKATAPREARTPDLEVNSLTL